MFGDLGVETYSFELSHELWRVKEGSYGDPWLVLLVSLINLNMTTMMTKQMPITQAHDIKKINMNKVISKETLTDSSSPESANSPISKVSSLNSLSPASLFSF